MQITIISSTPSHSFAEIIAKAFRAGPPIAKRITVDADGKVVGRPDFNPGVEFSYYVSDWNAYRIASWIERWHSAGTRDSAITLGVRKAGAPVRGPKRAADFARPSRQDMLVLDIDGMPFVEGLSRKDFFADPEAVVKKQVAALLGSYDFKWCFVLSSTAGFEKDGAPPFRGHLYIDLDRDYHAAAVDEAASRLQEQFPFVDGSIYNPSQFILAARPLLNVPDPFPRRVFYNNGKSWAELANVRDYDNQVALTLPAMRGKSGRVPAMHLKDDRLSYQFHNWLVALRRENPTFTWEQADAAMVAEFGRVERSERAKMAFNERRLKMNDLKRMWDGINTAGGPKAVYGDARYQEPEGSVDLAFSKMAAAVADQIERGGYFLNKVSLGVGKTQEIVDLVTSKPLLKTLLLAPNHERAEEMCQRLNDARQKNLDDLPYSYDEDPLLEALAKPWRVWRGRGRPGMCDRLPAVEAAQKARVSVHKSICGFGQEIQYPLFETCAYAGQVENFWRYRWIAPVAMIKHKSRIASEADIVIVDESCLGHLAAHRKSDLDELLTPRGERLNELSLQAYNDLRQGRRTMTFDELNEALELERGLLPSIDVRPDMADGEIKKRCGDLGAFNSARLSIWRALIDGHANALHVYERRAEGDEPASWRVQTSWKSKPGLLSKAKTVLFFDATPNVSAMKSHFPELEVEEFQARTQNTHVVQVINAKGVKSTFLNVDEENEKGEAQKKEKRGRWAAWLRAQPGYTVVVTKKEIRERMAEEQQFDRVAFAHFGAVEGQDRWVFPDATIKRGAEIDALVINGRSTPPPFVPEAEARAHFVDGELVRTIPWPEDGRMPWYEEGYQEIADGVAGVVLQHPDSRVDELFRGIWLASQMQAFGRGRSVRRESRLRVFIMQNLPLAVTVDEAVTDAVLAARVGEVTLLSPAEIERVFGYSGRFIEKAGIEANVAYWTREGQTKPFGARVAAGGNAEAALALLGAVRWEAARKPALQ